MKFFPAPGAMVRVPGTRTIPGQQTRYIGREYVAPVGGRVDKTGIMVDVVSGLPMNGSWTATGEAFECEDSGEIAERCAKFVRDGDLLPADEATAKIFGLKFFPLELRDGEMVAKSAKKDAS
jgi:hypothetical protein